MKTLRAVAIRDVQAVVGLSRQRSRHASRILQRGQAALEFLLEAHQCASELGCNVWDFAVEIEELRRLGLSKNDLRWLACKRFIEHARDVTAPGDDARLFEPSAALRFDDRTCFVLTGAGAAFAAQLDLVPPTEDGLCGELRPHIHPPTGGRTPKWDPDRQELRVGEMVVKQFKVPAINQERVLAAFEEEGWPVHIDDPLPPAADQDPKRRLHDTINSLNRNQRQTLIRFLGDGSGQGVRWELIEADGEGQCG